MAGPPVTRLRLIELLGRKDEDGNRQSFTALEICEELGMTRKQVDGALHFGRPSKSKPNRTKYFQIVDYERRIGITQGKWAPRYTLGDGPDAREPKRETHQIRNARYREKYRAVLRFRERKMDGVKMDHWFNLLSPSLKATKRYAPK